MGYYKSEAPLTVGVHDVSAVVEGIGAPADGFTVAVISSKSTCGTDTFY